MTPIALWFRAMRIPFLQATILPVVLGSALAYRDGTFSWGLFWAVTVAVAAINIGTNLSNDYFDHLSGEVFIGNPVFVKSTSYGFPLLRE